MANQSSSNPILYASFNQDTTSSARIDDGYDCKAITVLVLSPEDRLLFSSGNYREVLEARSQTQSFKSFYGFLKNFSPPITLSDVGDLLEWAGDNRMARHARWKTITSRAEALTYIEKVAAPHPWYRTICLDDRSIGYISIKPYSGEDRRRAHVSYAVAGDHWGQGIATMALRMNISLVFKEFHDLVRLETVVEGENRASQRVLEKVGFLKEGLLRKYG